MASAEAPLQQAITVGIVGLGLMGGSLAAALRHAWPEARLLGVARRPETLEGAVSVGYVHDGATAMADVVPHCDITVLALPVRSILAAIPEAARLLKLGATLTDLGSTKAEIVAVMAHSGRAEACVGGHPMCGKETHGLQAATPDLFQRATWAVCPGRSTSPEAIHAVTQMARAVGARPTLLDAAEHDCVVARTSHLPYVAAAALARAVAAGTRPEDIDLLSAGGYRDSTRLAASDVAMMRDTLMTNRQAVLAALADLGGELAALTALLQVADEPGLTAYLERARRSRRST